MLELRNDQVYSHKETRHIPSIPEIKGASRDTRWTGRLTAFDPKAFGRVEIMLVRGLQMPRYFFDVKDGRRLFDSSGFVCDDDTAAMIRATVLAVGVSIDTPEDDPERQIAIINDAGQEIGTVPVYSKPSYQNPAKGN